MLTSWIYATSANEQLASKCPLCFYTLLVNCLVLHCSARHQNSAHFSATWYIGILVRCSSVKYCAVQWRIEDILWAVCIQQRRFFWGNIQGWQRQKVTLAHTSRFPQSTFILEAQDNDIYLFCQLENFIKWSGCLNRLTNCLFSRLYNLCDA